MIYVKLNNKLYPATVSGRVSDTNWDGRESKSISLEMDYETAINLFVNGLTWRIVEKYEVDGEIQETEYDNSEYNLAGDITDHRDGTITAKVGKLTELEEAYILMFGGN